MIVQQYDVVVLGGGPGGYPAAIELAQAGLRVALIERDALGGNCVNYGCLPTKSLLTTAKKWQSFDRLTAFGIEANGRRLNFGQIQTNRKTLRTRLNQAIATNLTAAGVKIYFGTGEVVSEHEVVVNEEVLQFGKLILATGSQNRFLALAGFSEAKAQGFLGESNFLLSLAALPASLVIVGGGPVALEFAYFYAALGTKVTILQDLPDLIPQFDTAIIEVATASLVRLGVEIICGVKVQQMTAERTLIYTKNQSLYEIQAEKFCLAVGRMVNDAAFAKLKLARNEQNKLVINDHMQTSLDHVYAVGDVTAQMQLSSVAYLQGAAAVRHILNKSLRPLNLLHVPSALYLQPELAMIGATETMLAQQAPDGYLKIELPAAKLPRNHVEQTTQVGFFKLLVDRQTHMILGACMALENAAVIINELALAMSSQLTVHDLAIVAHTHPTLSEAVYYVARSASLQLS